MSLFDKIKLPKSLVKATGAKMKFSIGRFGDFEVTFKNSNGMLNEMPSINEHVNEEIDYSRPRIM